MNTQTVTASIVRFPHGAESVPAEVNGKPTRFVSIDEDGSMLAWASEEAPEFDEGMGCWIAPGIDVMTVRTVGDGEYFDCASSLRAITFH
jgi:hypothetical protein